jgi:hypothetical protein
LKNNCPKTQVAGRDVPTVIGSVTGYEEKFGFRPCEPKLIVVGGGEESCANSDPIVSGATSANRKPAATLNRDEVLI